LTIPDDIADPAIIRTEAQDADRGGRWASPRAAEQPDPPWPSLDSPVLRYLLVKAEASVSAGMDIGTALMQLAVHAWFEGGIENYDRGQADGRRPRGVT
jgi:hypothetical protein